MCTITLLTISPVILTAFSIVRQPQAGTADYGFSIILTSAKHLPVVLKDVHAPKSGAMQPLGAVTVNTNADAPGCFYKSPHASALIDAFRVEGSCARVVKDEGMDAAQKEYFEQFVARLKEGDLVSIARRIHYGTTTDLWFSISRRSTVIRLHSALPKTHLQQPS